MLLNPRNMEIINEGRYENGEFISYTISPKTNQLKDKLYDINTIFMNQEQCYKV